MWQLYRYVAVILDKCTSRAARGSYTESDKKSFAPSDKSI